MKSNGNKRQVKRDLWSKIAAEIGALDSSEYKARLERHRESDLYKAIRGAQLVAPFEGVLLDNEKLETIAEQAQDCAEGGAFVDTEFASVSVTYNSDSKFPELLLGIYASIESQPAQPASEDLQKYSFDEVDQDQAA